MLDKHEKRRRAVIKALRPLHHDEPHPEHDDEALEALRREVEIDDQHEPE